MTHRASPHNRHPAPSRRAGIPPMLAVALGSLVALAVLVFAFVRLGSPPTGAAGREPLMLYCAAGIKPAISEIAERYTEEFGRAVHVQYGGSGTLLGQIEVNPRGDLYLAADDSYVPLGREKGLLAESIPLATQHLVIAVAAGNPKQIGSAEDLLREGVRFALANPDAAAVGRVARAALEPSGLWARLEPACATFKPTVNELATDVKIGAVDAAIIWDSTANQVDGIEAVEDPALTGQPKLIEIAVLAASEQPTQALHLARYIAARDRGGEAFDRLGYGSLARDVWADRPQLLLFAGSMFTAAVDQTVHDFEIREGVEITRVYNGCGILVSQMKAGGKPDAYFSCDDSFMDNVNDRFVNRIEVSENPMVIATAPGNPKGIASLEDLLEPGLRVGLAHPEKSALGHLTARMLEGEGLLEGLKESGNWKLDAPQGDFLVNQLLTGALDAAIVYVSNTAAAGNKLNVLQIESDMAIARQPFAVARDSDHARTMQRLINTCVDAESREVFERLGFRWIREASEPGT